MKKPVVRNDRKGVIRQKRKEGHQERARAGNVRGH